MSVIEIKVSAAPRGDSYTSGLNFKFTSTSQYLKDENGNLEFPRGSGRATLVFHLVTRSVNWPRGPHEISFLVSDDADAHETLWVWHEKTTPGRYQGQVFSGFALSPDETTNQRHMVLAVTSATEAAGIYHCKLDVGVITKDGIHRISHDPRIINGGGGGME